ncbi:MAG: hypothetical protein CL840_11325 [Crocinitomicaceae bacterium]|nr:hypothetical protein [Crocinitomicaceae bacterium]|tara:strand:- start:12289 stop:13308 length:1020 start_codon:yes stop_codon:yes gene_type:complete
MKKALIYVLLIMILATTLFFLLDRQSKSTIKKQLTDFAIEDTASINKIFLADKSNKTVLLEKQGNDWMVNNEFKAKPEMVDILLNTIHSLKIRTPVPKSMHNNVVKRLSGHSVKIEIYQNNENSPSKVYYVGGPNADHTGTYMLLENSSVPFVMHLEGHYGFLDTRYSTDALTWRDNYIWKFPGESIKRIESITITNHLEAKESFSIKQVGDGQYEFYNYDGRALQVDRAMLLGYIKNYQSVAYEGFEEVKSKAYLDSIIYNTPRIFTLELKTKDGEATSITTWNKPMTEAATDLVTGEPILYDVNRFYALINNKNMVIAQYFTFDQLTPKASQFNQPN